MSRYLKLVNFELSRFMKIYLVLIAITVISQITGIIVKSKGYLNEVHRTIYGDSISKAQYIEEYGTITFMDYATSSLWFLAPIALCIAALMFYVFFIWYRDWFGKNTFIYRLLLLPSARLNVLLAKATTILLLVFGLVSIQLILLPIENNIFKWIIPLDFRTDLPIHEMLEQSHELSVLIPRSFVEFIIHYGIGIMAVLVIFTAILFERSYRLKGILMAILFGLLAIVIFFLQDFVELLLQKNYLYPIEHLVVRGILGTIVIGLSIWVSNFLLNKKINV
ncbi:hypothetical protein JOC34_002078 [Virgibacillus halotolerans]|uniref:hypothetical protein n=1 Tax=Virgibacillus halotolerans TaxID=1071053 RepID=UPI0019601014|nr:hypothetical protein [Virgibacillus halotolerans]MBM7599710.1 hypothetical protein [Virgibacillus halotolerans]